MASAEPLQALVELSRCAAASWPQSRSVLLVLAALRKSTKVATPATGDSSAGRKKLAANFHIEHACRESLVIAGTPSASGSQPQVPCQRVGCIHGRPSHHGSASPTDSRMKSATDAASCDLASSPSSETLVRNAFGSQLVRSPILKRCAPERSVAVPLQRRGPEPTRMMTVLPPLRRIVT